VTNNFSKGPSLKFSWIHVKFVKSDSKVLFVNIFCPIFKFDSEYYIIPEPKRTETPMYYYAASLEPEPENNQMLCFHCIINLNELQVPLSGPVHWQ
jgi:hypothetical protein